MMTSGFISLARSWKRLRHHFSSVWKPNLRNVYLSSRKPAVATCLAATGGMLYLFHDNNYQVHATIRQIKLHYYKLKYFMLSKNDAMSTKQNVFQTVIPSIQPKLLHLFTDYFLKRDLEQENGITKQDICSLLEECGIRNLGSLPPIQVYMRPERKSLPRCTIQDAANLIDSVMSCEQLEIEPGNPSIPQGVHTTPKDTLEYRLIHLLFAKLDQSIDDLPNCANAEDTQSSMNM